MFSLLLSLRKKITWAVSGNIVFALSQWAILTVLARLGTATDLGQYSLALALTAPVILFFNFNLRALLATDSVNQYTFSQYFSSRVFHMFIAILIILIIAVMYSADIMFIIILVGLIKFIESLSDICLGFFQKKGKLDLIGKSQFLRGVYSATVFFVTFYFTRQLIISLMFLLIIVVLRLIYFDIKKIKKLTVISLKINWISVEIMWYALPLGISALITSLNTNVPRYILDYFFGIEYVGIYSALYYVLVASNMLITPISLLAAPRLSKSYHYDSNESFMKLTLSFIFMSIVFFIIIFLPILFYSDILLKLFYGSKFQVYSDVFIVLSFSMLFAFTNSFLNLVIISARKLKIQTVLNAVILFITFFSGVFLIRQYGIKGSAWLIVISRFIQTILFGVLVMCIFKEHKYLVLRKRNKR